MSLTPTQRAVIGKQLFYVHPESCLECPNDYMSCACPDPEDAVKCWRWRLQNCPLVIGHIYLDEQNVSHYGVLAFDTREEAEQVSKRR